MTNCLIVGGGIIGLSLAYELSRRGLSVTVAEQGAWGGQASSAAAGMLAPLKEFSQPGPLLDPRANRSRICWLIGRVPPARFNRDRRQARDWIHPEQCGLERQQVDGSAHEERAGVEPGGVPGSCRHRDKDEDGQSGLDGQEDGQGIPKRKRPARSQSGQIFEFGHDWPRSDSRQPGCYNRSAITARSASQYTECTSSLDERPHIPDHSGDTATREAAW